LAKPLICLSPPPYFAQVGLTGFPLIFGRRKAVVPHTVARFRQINLDDPITHHDALEFYDGEIVLLTHLLPGQHATVLQLPAASEAPSNSAVTVAPIAAEAVC
jgi:hypothetical protein